MRVEIVDPALDEAEVAHRYYLRIDPELGEDFALELQRSIEWIVALPLVQQLQAEHMSQQIDKVLA